MATQYHDWITQATDTLKLQRLELHIAELQQMMSGPDVSADGKSINRSALQAQLAQLYALYPQFRRQAALETKGCVTKAVFRNPNERQVGGLRTGGYGSGW